MPCLIFQSRSMLSFFFPSRILFSSSFDCRKKGPFEWNLKSLNHFIFICFLKAFSEIMVTVNFFMDIISHVKLSHSVIVGCLRISPFIFCLFSQSVSVFCPACHIFYVGNTRFYFFYAGIFFAVCYDAVYLEVELFVFNKFVKHDFTLLFSFLCTLFIINIFLDSNFQIDAIAN